MEAKIIKNRNAGNSPNTYFKGWSEREYCIQTGGDYARDSAGRVRRFVSRDSAEKAALKAGLQIVS